MSVGIFQQWLTQCKKILYEWGSSSEIYESYFVEDWKDYWEEKYEAGMTPKEAVDEAYWVAVENQP